MKTIRPTGRETKQSSASKAQGSRLGPKRQQRRSESPRQDSPVCALSFTYPLAVRYDDSSSRWSVLAHRTLAALRTMLPQYLRRLPGDKRAWYGAGSSKTSPILAAGVEG